MGFSAHIEGYIANQPTRNAALVEQARSAIAQIPRQRFNDWVNLAEYAVSAGKVHQQAGYVESAFIEFAKAAIIMLEKLPAHPDYASYIDEEWRRSWHMLGQELMVKYLTRPLSYTRAVASNARDTSAQRGRGSVEARQRPEAGRWDGKSARIPYQDASRPAEPYPYGMPQPQKPSFTSPPRTARGQAPEVVTFGKAVESPWPTSTASHPTALGPQYARTYSPFSPLSPIESMIGNPSSFIGSPVSLAGSPFSTACNSPAKSVLSISSVKTSHHSFYLPAL